MLNFRPVGFKKEHEKAPFYRSDLPRGLTEEELQAFEDLGITTIIDLRSPEELATEPNDLAESDKVIYHHKSLSSGNLLSIKEADQVMQSYLDLAMTQTMGEILEILADAPEAALFHCTAGKDRTGTVAAVLGKLAGVPNEQIVEEYILSAEKIEPMYQKWIDMGIPMALIVPKREYIVGFLELFDERFPTVGDYMKEIGMTQETKGKLFEKFNIGAI